MASGYKSPMLCNYYCTHECVIGKKCLRETVTGDLSQIILETLASLNAIRKRQDRLIEITSDGIIDGDEIDDYILIKKDLLSSEEFFATLFGAMMGISMVE